MNATPDNITPANPVVLEGHMLDAKKRWTPIDTIDPVDIDRDEMVNEWINEALEIETRLREFKLKMLGDIQAFTEMSNERYGVKLGGKKGNISLQSYDGRKMVKRAMQDCLKFDERLQGAKGKIDNCLKRWTDESANEVRAIIEDVFQVDKEGKIRTQEVLSLRRFKFDDKEWQEAMDMIADSLQVVGSTTYVQFSHREEPDAPWKPITLSLAKV